MATKKQSKKKKVVKKVSKKVKTEGIGSYCKALIMSGKYSRDEILKMSKKKYKDSAVNSKHLSYYVWSIKKDGKTPPPFAS